MGFHRTLIRKFLRYLPDNIRYKLAYAVFWVLYGLGSVLFKNRSKWQRCFKALRKEKNYILYLFIKYLPYDSDWHSRIRVEGAEEFYALQSKGVPIVGCFLHSGHYKQNRFLLNSVGLRVKSLVQDRDNLQLTSEMMHEANTFQLDELKQACQYLKAGGWLNVAVDVEESASLKFTFSDGESLRFSSGAFRLALSQRAYAVAIRVDDLPNSRIGIHLSHPIEVKNKSDYPKLAEQLYHHLYPTFLNQDFRSSAYGRFVFGHDSKPQDAINPAVSV